jgi:hypothetical protein
MSTRKLAKNDLDQIQSIGQRYDELTNTLGNLEIEKFTLSLRRRRTRKITCNRIG